jgi:large subunit ribosomal protein L25
MKLKLFKRDAAKKGEVKRLRREGKIPAVVYKHGQAGDNIAIEASEFSAFLRKVQPGRLSTSVFTLADESGRSFRAIVKDIQYNPVNYNVVHLDFEELVDDVKINIKVPIEFVGVVDCVGVKLGGVLRQVIRQLRVRCLPQDIPEVFQLDVRDLGQRESRRLSDLSIPDTVRPLANLKEVVVVVAKR